MYQQFYGLRELPFELTPNPKYLFLTQQHREALTTLEYGLSTAKGVTALIGEAGTGKTTLIHAALESERCRNVTCVYLVNPTLTRAEFVEILSLRFGLSSRAASSKAVLLQELEGVVRARRARGQITALVIDEAQSLSDELLEEIRLLANSETATEKLLPLVLAGQPELRDRLNEPSLRQLKQRVTLRSEITPFDQQDTAAYIARRIRTAGGDASRIFTREAVILIHERSRGIPRMISVICDNALLTGFGLGRARVDSEVVAEVARDFDLAEVGVSRSPMLDQPSRDPVQDEMPSLPPQPEMVPIVMETPNRAGGFMPDIVPDVVPDVAPAEPPAPVENSRPMFAAPRPSSRFSFFSRR